MADNDIEFELDEGETQFEASEDSTWVPLREDSETSATADAPAAGVPFNGFAQRFYELSERQQELSYSESELSREIDEILSEMEREYFLGGLIKKAGSFVKKAASSLGKSIPGAVTSLASSALKGGMLNPLAQAALSFVPGGSMVFPALQAMGFGSTSQGMPQMPQMQQMGYGMPPMPDFSKWMNLAQLFQDSFSQLAARVAPMQGEITDPTEAVRLASDSFQAALQGLRPGSRRGRRVITLSPGDEIVIKVR